MFIRICFQAFAALVCSPLAFAGVIVVNPTPGQPDVIQQAIAAANPGDTVFVRTGFYQHTAPIEIDKSLTLLGEGSFASAYVALPAGSDSLALYVHDIDASEEVRVVGMQFSVSSGAPGAFGAGSGGPVMLVEDCAGPVSIAGVQGFTSGVVTTSSASLTVRNSAQVVVDKVRVQVLMATDVTPIAALRAENSTVWVNDSILLGGGGISVSATTALDGGAGIHAIGSVLRVSRSDVRGGPGGQATGFGGFAPASVGGHAIDASASQVEVVGGPGGSVQGGTGGLGFPGGIGVGGSGVFVAPTSSVLISQDALVQGGYSGDFGSQSLDVGGTGSQALSTLRFASLAVTFPVIATGGTQGFSVAGEPGSFAVLGYSVKQAPAVLSPTGVGALCLNLANVTLFAYPPLDFTGTAFVSRPVPATPALVGLVITAQAAVFDPNLNLSYSAPVLMGVI